MNPKIIKTGGEEAEIQKKIIDFLTLKGWFVKATHGNLYSQGFPDLFCCHTSYGHRWVEVKKPVGFVFQPSQIEWFPKMVAHGSGVWIMTEASEEQYKWLFKPCNWWQFLGVFHNHKRT